MAMFPSHLEFENPKDISWLEIVQKLTGKQTKNSNVSRKADEVIGEFKCRQRGASKNKPSSASRSKPDSVSRADQVVLE